MVGHVRRGALTARFGVRGARPRRSVRHAAPLQATDVEYVTKSPAIFPSDGPLVAASFQLADSDKMKSCCHGEGEGRGILNCGCKFSTCTCLRQDEILSPQRDTMESCCHGEPSRTSSCNMLSVNSWHVPVRCGHECAALRQNGRFASGNLLHRRKGMDDFFHGQLALGCLVDIGSGVAAGAVVRVETGEHSLPARVHLHADKRITYRQIVGMQSRIFNGKLSHQPAG